MLVLRGVSSVFEIAFCIIMFEFRASLRSELGSVNLGLQFGMYIVRIQCIEIHAIDLQSSCAWEWTLSLCDPWKLTSK